MAASILPFDFPIDMTSLTNQSPLLVVKVEGDPEINQESGKGFQDSLLAFEDATAEGAKISDFPLQLASVPKAPPPFSKEKTTLETTKETALPEAESNRLSSSQILNTLITPPLQKDALALKENIALTSLENAEAVLEEEVSMTALSYAMALQEKENRPLKQSKVSQEQKDEGEFPALRLALTLPSGASLDSIPTIEANADSLNQSAQELITPPQEAISQKNAEITASLTDIKETILPPTAKTTPSHAKQESLTNGSPTAVEKEAHKPLVQSQAHVDGNLREDRPDSTQEEEGEFASEDAPNSLVSKEGKKSTSPLNSHFLSAPSSKAPASSAGSSSAQAGLTSLQSGSLESIEGKEAEEAFHRGSASIDARIMPTRSTQAPSSQAALSYTASLQEQVAFSIKNNAPKGKSEISLQLRPDSLGRLNIKIDINKEGQTFVVVTAERTETRDLLQRDSQQLMELLEQSDLEINDENMSYSLFKDQEQKEFEEKQENSSDITADQGKGNAVLKNTAEPLISLGMSEIQIPRHGGTWQAIA
ncbi:MAG: flagellar hook-length control protein FliK [Alphaproteobacteria bacterium]|nr:flagellar hook-length control protein FliK [Alphaproteobacteria bacterium]NCQ66746.1 flagellar hook-length control protein FliK [Alphaproteobacteria bacterium]NCT07197.1 flagellar hook-length control protein FliK [Alphaproteobacteria bacterium]